MKSKRILTQEEKYLLDYMGAFRIGKITAVRKMLINALRIKGEEHNRIISKAVVYKINRETDIPWMTEVLFAIFKDQLSPEAFEEHYDRLFLLPDADAPEARRSFDKLPLQGITDISGMCE